MVMRYDFDVDTSRRIGQTAFGAGEVVTIVSLVAMPFLSGYSACSNDIPSRSSISPVQRANI